MSTVQHEVCEIPYGLVAVMEALNQNRESSDGGSPAHRASTNPAASTLPTYSSAGREPEMHPVNSAMSRISSSVAGAGQQDVRYHQAASASQHTEGLTKDRILIRRQVDDAVGEDHVDAVGLHGQ